MFQFAPHRRRRRPSLTPMIDVVFLLLVFFMLASQFGRDTALPFAAGGADAGYDGPPRLVAVGPQSVALNGQAVPLAAISDALAGLTTAGDDVIVLRAVDGASLQRLVEIAETLAASGFTNLALVE
jgi:biopolymer transport protein ExbD